MRALDWPVRAEFSPLGVVGSGTLAFRPTGLHPVERRDWLENVKRIERSSTERDEKSTSPPAFDVVS